MPCWQPISFAADSVQRLLGKPDVSSPDQGRATRHGGNVRVYYSMPHTSGVAEMAVDMPETTSSTRQPDALRRLIDSVLAGNDVTLFIRSDDGRALLDAAADRLATLRCRVLRAAGTPSEGLSLPVLMSQIVGQPAPGAQDDEFLKRGFQALTTLDGTCDRIVLLVSDANTLQPAVLRYIQLACRAGTALQLVLAGRRGFLDLLGPHEFAHLRTRLATGPIITPPSTPATAPMASPPQHLPSGHDLLGARALRQDGRQSSRPVLSGPADTSRRKRFSALAGIGLATAACIALAIWAGKGGGGEPVATPGQQAMLVIESPTVPNTAAAAASEAPSPVAAAVPAAPQPTAVVPAPAVPQPPAATPQANAPAAPLPAATPSASSPSLQWPSLPLPGLPSPSLPKSAARKVTQPRIAMTRAPALNARSVAAWEDPYSPPPPRDWQPLPPPVLSGPPDQPKSYIGTYTTDANGVRGFRFSR